MFHTLRMRYVLGSSSATSSTEFSFAAENTPTNVRRSMTQVQTRSSSRVLAEWCKDGVNGRHKRCRWGWAGMITPQTCFAYAVIEAFIPLRLSYIRCEFNHEPQDELLSVSAAVLERAVEDGSWDPAIFTPALELLENVMDGYNSSSSSGVVGKDELGEQGAET